MSYEVYVKFFNLTAKYMKNFMFHNKLTVLN